MTITQIRKANELAGHTFFDPSHTRHSKTLPTVYQGNGRILFLTDDRGEPEGFKLVRAWEFNPETATIRIIASFETLEAATAAAIAAVTPAPQE